jgi:hypothetical protein
LAQAPEILLETQPMSKAARLAANLAKAKTEEEIRQAHRELSYQHRRAMEHVAYVNACINHLNEQGTDHFLKVLRPRRPDLAGLPFVMGDACRQRKEQSQAFVLAVDEVREALQATEPIGNGPGPEKPQSFWDHYNKFDRHARKKAASEEDALPPADIAALTQMLAPEGQAMHQGLVKYLAKLPHAQATRALVRLAVFSFDDQVRQAALAVLKDRPKEELTEPLLAGLRYPWPAIAQHASEAVVQLGRKDLLPQLAALMDEPDPRGPIATQTDGAATYAVREVVRINHHRNCLLCHPPGNTPDVGVNKFGVSDSVVTGAVPSPYESLPSPAHGYGFSSPDILVRADVTYLQQDFSLLQPVKDAALWPEKQRFDFLVRTRTVPAEAAAEYRAWVQEQGPNYLAPHRQAALAALRALTGRDAAPTAQAWRAVLAD